MDISLAEKIKHEMLGNGLTDHNGCSWLCSYQGTQGRAQIGVSSEEKKILRNLASQVAILAEHLSRRNAASAGRPTEA